MIVRTATINDADDICAIWNPLIAQTTTTFTTELKTAERISADINTRNGAFFVAERNGEIIGFATYFAFRGGPGYARTKEHSINLAPSARGCGAGRALMQALEAHAFKEGVHSLWAGISAENLDGIAFHDRMGFAHIACLSEVGFKFDRWMDLILMQKILR